MTVTTQKNSISHTGDGVQLVFGYDFLVYRATHMTVFLDGVEQTSGFVVDEDGLGNPQGGTVTFTVAPGAGVTVLLRRSVPLVQLVDYVPYDPFPADTHEEALDLLTMIAQQLEIEIERALRYRENEEPTGGTVLPAPEANKAIGYGSAGELVNIVVGEGGSPVRNPLQEALLTGGFSIHVTDAALNLQAMIGWDPTNGGLTIEGTSDGATIDTRVNIQGAPLLLNGEPPIEEAPDDGEQYARQSQAWQQIDVPAGTIISDTAPANPTEGLYWLQSTTGRLFVWYVSGPGNEQWIEVGPAPLGNADAFELASEIVIAGGEGIVAFDVTGGVDHKFIIEQAYPNQNDHLLRLAFFSARNGWSFDNTYTSYYGVSNGAAVQGGAISASFIGSAQSNAPATDYPTFGHVEVTQQQTQLSPTVAFSRAFSASSADVLWSSSNTIVNRQGLSPTDYDVDTQIGFVWAASGGIPQGTWQRGIIKHYRRRLAS